MLLKCGHDPSQDIFPFALTASVVSEVSTQTDLLTADGALQVLGCKECLGSLWEAWADSQLSCRRCAVHELCRLNLSSREVCCLPEAWIQDIVERLPKLVHKSDYNFLLLFHVGANDTRGKLETIKQDFRALGVAVKGLRAQVIFPSVLPVREKDGRRREQTFQVNNWLWCWCRQQGFGFFDHGTLIEDQELTGREMASTSLRGVNVSLLTGWPTW